MAVRDAHGCPDTVISLIIKNNEKGTKMKNPPSLYEKFAAIEHERWADWQKYMHGKCMRNEDGSLTIPAALVDRWERQIQTKYEDLSEQEKKSDRERVNRYWPLV